MVLVPYFGTRMQLDDNLKKKNTKRIRQFPNDDIKSNLCTNQIDHETVFTRTLPEVVVKVLLQNMNAE